MPKLKLQWTKDEKGRYHLNVPRMDISVWPALAVCTGKYIDTIHLPDRPKNEKPCTFAITAQKRVIRRLRELRDILNSIDLGD